MKPSRKNLLLLGPHHFHAYLWTGEEIAQFRQFNNDHEGYVQFSSYLEQHRYPAYLLADVIEEDFRRETVPHLSGKNRRELIARKFDQYYRGTPFRQARTQQRHSEGRRDDEMLFSALTNPQHFAPWLDILLKNRIPLIGIYSLPEISTFLARRTKSEHVLLLSWEKHAGLRQSYFNKQHLQFSRLTAIGEHSSFVATAAIETPRIQQYLSSLNQPPHGEVLDVNILCHCSERQAFELALQNRPELRYAFLDIQELADEFKTGASFPDSDATLLFLHRLARIQSAPHYATAQHTHYHRLWQLRKVLLACAAALTLGGVSWSAIALWQARGYSAQAQPLLDRTMQLNTQTQNLKQHTPASSITAGDMKAAVTLAREFDKYFPAPETFLLNLSGVLDQFARIHSNKIAWQSSTATAPAAAYPAQLIFLDGELLGFGNDYRNALAYLDRFRQALHAAGYSVTVLNQPFDTSSGGTISGNLQDIPEESARFSLQLMWRQKQ